MNADPQWGTDAGDDLRLITLTKTFGTFTAVDDLSLTIPAGSFFALLGPSGCGKTTTLRMIAGLEEPTVGSLWLGSKELTGLRPYKRPVNTVFQNYALFPHLDVFENVAFGLRRRGIRKVQQQVKDTLAMVELSGYERRRPGQLSGGQQQRVALARGLINHPKVLLLDEPLGALDLKLRRQMQIELKRIQLEVGTTFVHVTHDQEEAMTMADTIAVMNQGKVEQLGAPADLYESPATTFVANFLGQSNLLRGRVSGRSGSDLTINVQGRRLVMPAARSRATGSDVWVGVRPEKLHVAVDGEQSSGGPSITGQNSIEGVITDSSFIGVSTQYLVRTGWDHEIMVFAQNLGTHGPLPVGQRVVVHWDPAHTFALDVAPDEQTLTGAFPAVDPVGAPS